VRCSGHKGIQDETIEDAERLKALPVVPAMVLVGIGTARATDPVMKCQEAWILVKDDIACAPKGELQVKAFQRVVSAYEVGAAGRSVS
jgi:hypothetical protein